MVNEDHEIQEHARQLAKGEEDIQEQEPTMVAMLEVL